MNRLGLNSIGINTNFSKLWVGHSILTFGSQVADIALGLTAIGMLNATAAQMGILGALRGVPFLLVGLIAGALADQLSRRPILFATSVARVFIMISVPIASITGHLTMNHIYIVGFLLGVLAVFYSASSLSFVPFLVERKDLVTANSRMQFSQSGSAIAGPGIGGVLVQLLTAPIAIFMDAISAAINAFCVWRIDPKMEEAKTPRYQRSLRRDIADGLALVWGDRRLRSMALSKATYNLFNSMILAVYLIFLTENVRISPSLIGIVIGMAGPGALVGAMLSRRVEQQFGVKVTLMGALLLAGIGAFGIPIAAWFPSFSVIILILSQFLVGFAIVNYDINQISLRQMISPAHMQGRVNSSMRLIHVGLTVPVGSLVGGILGQTLGLPETVLIACIGILCACLWLVIGVGNLSDTQMNNT